MTKTTRKIVYVLGAGFSYGTGHYIKWGQSDLHMPLQNNLLERIFRYHFKTIRQLDVIAKLIRRYFSPDTFRSKRSEGSSRHQDLKDLSVEEIVTFFEEMVRDLQPNKAKEFRKAETALRRLTVELIADLSTNGFPGNNDILKNYRELLLGTDTVITFNWDTLLERVLANKGKWHPAWGYGAAVRNTFHYAAKKVPKSLKKHVTVLKLHGSINWLATEEERIITKSFSPNGRFDDVVMMPPKMLKREIWGEEPTEEKTGTLCGNWAVHSRRLYPKIWREAETHLVRAKRIVFIGYSFPAADTSVYGLLRRSLSEAKTRRERGEHPEIFIVDPNAAQLARRFYQSFKIEVPPQNQFLSLESYVLPRTRLSRNRK